MKRSNKSNENLFKEGRASPLPSLPNQSIGDSNGRQRTMMRIMDHFERLVSLLERVQVAAGILCVAIIGTIIPLQVFCRYILNAPLIWPEDVGIGLMVWLGFLGTAVLYKKGQHVAVEFFKNRFPPKAFMALTLAIDLMIGCLTALIILFSFDLNKLQMMTIQVGTGIPRGYFYSLPLLVNMCILLIYNLQAILKGTISIFRS
jgi:TRAP-type transport system small permease protein